MRKREQFVNNKWQVGLLFNDKCKRYITLSTYIFIVEFRVAKSKTTVIILHKCCMQFYFIIENKTNNRQCIKILLQLQVEDFRFFEFY